MIDTHTVNKKNKEIEIPYRDSLQRFFFEILCSEYMFIVKYLYQNVPSWSMLYCIWSIGISNYTV